MNRRLDLDYVAPPLGSRGGGLALLALALAVAAGVLVLHRDEAQEHEMRRARWQQLERTQQRSAGRVAVAGAQELQADIRRANEVTAQLDLPWSPLFQAVEAATQETVALLGIQPDAQKRTVSIAAESKDMASAIEYVKRLAKEPLLSQVHIVNHQVQEQDPERPLRFSVQASWREEPRRDK